MLPVVKVAAAGEADPIRPALNRENAAELTMAAAKDELKYSDQSFHVSSLLAVLIVHQCVSSSLHWFATALVRLCIVRHCPSPRLRSKVLFASSQVKSPRMLVWARAMAQSAAP